MNGMDGANQLIVQHVFGEIGSDAGLQRATDVFIAAVRAQRYDAGVGIFSPDRRRGFQPLIPGIRMSISVMSGLMLAE